MPIDPSIVLQAKPPSFDAVGLLGHVAELGGALNQNKLFQQEFKARSAIGPLYQQSIDPATGQLDTNKLLGLAAGNPDVAFKAGDIASEALARENTQVQISGAQLDQSIKKLQATRGVFGSVLADPNAGPQDAINGISQLVESKVLSPQEAQAGIADMPTDPAQFRKWATAHLVNSLDSEKKLAAVWGSPQSVSAGGKTVILSVSPNPEVKPREIAEVANTLSPGEKAAPRSTFVNGQPGTVPTSSVVDDYGNARGPGGVPVFNGPGGGAAAAPAAGGPGGFLPSGPKLGQSEAAAVAGQANAQQGVQLQSRADQVPATKALLGNLEGELSKIKTGPGADWTNVAKTFVNRNNPLGQWFDPTKIASQEEFNKQSLQLAQAQFQALGGTGTDAKLNSTLHTSPNAALSNMGNQGIIAMLKGNEDAIAAKAGAWQKWLDSGHGSETYGQFQTQFNKIYDPRVFQFQYLDAGDQAKALKGMSPAERKTFDKARGYAKQFGWAP